MGRRSIKRKQGTGGERRGYRDISNRGKRQMAESVSEGKENTGTTKRAGNQVSQTHAKRGKLTAYGQVNTQAEEGKGKNPSLLGGGVVFPFKQSYPTKVLRQTAMGARGGGRGPETWTERCKVCSPEKTQKKPKIPGNPQKVTQNKPGFSATGMDKGVKGIMGLLAALLR